MADPNFDLILTAEAQAMIDSERRFREDADVRSLVLAVKHAIIKFCLANNIDPRDWKEVDAIVLENGSLQLNISWNGEKRG